MDLHQRPTRQRPSQHSVRQHMQQMINAAAPVTQKFGGGRVTPRTMEKPVDAISPVPLPFMAENCR